MGTRRRSRVLALQALYEFDCAGHALESTLPRLIEANPVSEEAASFARELAQGVVANEERLDAIIHTHAPEFPVAQLSAIDRNILRLAIFELLIQGKVPLKVAINEAVELAKLFGSLNSPRFINGVLGAVSSAAPQPPYEKP